MPKPHVLIGAAVVAFALVFFSVGYTLPSAWERSAKVRVDARAVDVIDGLADLSSWHRWSPWPLGNGEGTATLPGDGGRQLARIWEWDEGRGVIRVADFEPGVSVDYTAEWRGQRSQGRFVARSQGAGCLLEWQREVELGHDMLARWSALWVAPAAGGGDEEAILDRLATGFGAVSDASEGPGPGDPGTDGVEVPRDTPR